MALTVVPNSLVKASLPQLTPEQQGALIRAKQYAMQESVKHVLKKQQMQAGLPSGAGSGAISQAQQLQRQQALVLMCRVYVGSIFYDLKEEIVRNAFNPFGIIKSINMSFDPITGKHKGFAFIEYETADGAQMAMEQMGGALLGGRPIKVGRPSNMPTSHPIIDQILEESKSTNRIYVSNVHEDLSIDDLKSVFSAFGKITRCTLAPDPTTGKHKGYGSVEYDSVQSARDAISSMNLFDLGGQSLRVCRGIGPPPSATGASLGSAITGLPVTSTIMNVPSPSVTMPNMMLTKNNQVPYNSIPPPGVVVPTPRVILPTVVGVPTLPTFPNVASSTVSATSLANIDEIPNTLSKEEDFKLSGTGARHLLMHKLMRPSTKSPIMKLCNMVDVEEIDEDLESEVTEECGKFGTVKKVIIYQEKQGEEEDASCIVKIFVEFESVESAIKAVEGLNARWFGGRKIGASHFPEDKYSIGDFND